MASSLITTANVWCSGLWPFRNVLAGASATHIACVHANDGEEQVLAVACIEHAGKRKPTSSSHALKAGRILHLKGASPRRQPFLDSSASLRFFSTPMYLQPKRLGNVYGCNAYITAKGQGRKGLGRCIASTHLNPEMEMALSLSPLNSRLHHSLI